jgi:hypothetical protein
VRANQKCLKTSAPQNKQLGYETKKESDFKLVRALNLAALT